MKKRTLFALALLLFLVGITAAQDVLVEYVEGTVELRGLRGWSELYIGDTLPIDATVRLRDGGLLELRSGERTYLISRGGTYGLPSIIDTGERNSAAGIGAVARRGLRRLVTEEDRRPTTAVAGVRADEAVDRSEVTWAGGESVSELIEEGLTLLGEDAVEDAYYVFYDAWEYAGTEDLPRTQFYLGYSAYLIGSRAEALGYLQSPPPDPDTPFYDDHLLTLTQILVESFDYAGAKELLNGYLSGASPEGADLQSAYLLGGLAYEGEGEVDEARDFFEQARQVDPESEFGQLAASFIAEM